MLALLNKKQNFVISQTDKTSFGDYEFFFEINSLITCKVISRKCKIYYYEYSKFNSLLEEKNIIKETLKFYAFNKLKSLLKRMINVYNSYFILNFSKRNLLKTEKNNILVDNNSNIQKYGNQAKKTLFHNYMKSMMSMNCIKTKTDFSLYKDNNQKRNYNTSNYLYESNFNSTSRKTNNTSNYFPKNKAYSYDKENNIFNSNNFIHSLNKKKIIINYIKKKKKNNTQSYFSSTKKIVETPHNKIGIKIYQKFLLKNVFLPPLINKKETINKKMKESENKSNKNLFKYPLSVNDSINDVSIGNKEKINKDDINNLILSNKSDEIKTQKYNSKNTIDLKKVQIKILKNSRDKLKKLWENKYCNDFFDYYDNY